VLECRRSLRRRAAILFHFPLEVLHVAFVFLGGFLGVERSQVSPLGPSLDFSCASTDDTSPDFSFLIITTANQAISLPRLLLNYAAQFSK